MAGKCFDGKADMAFPGSGSRGALRLPYGRSGPHPRNGLEKYLTAVLLFNAAGFLVLFLSLLCQKWLPLNPAGTENMRWDIALNTAISFVTNTNWQFYSGEGPEGVSYFVQMTGLGVQNFVSAGTGIAVMSALIRGLERRCASTLGNFWTDLTRSTLYFWFLFPRSLLFCWSPRVWCSPLTDPLPCRAWMAWNR